MLAAKVTEIAVCNELLSVMVHLPRRRGRTYRQTRRR
jgi:hypothetical protein